MPRVKTNAYVNDQEFNTFRRFSETQGFRRENEELELVVEAIAKFPGLAWGVPELCNQYGGPPINKTPLHLNLSNAVRDAFIQERGEYPAGEILGAYIKLRIYRPVYFNHDRGALLLARVRQLQRSKSMAE